MAEMTVYKSSTKTVDEAVVEFLSELLARKTVSHAVFRKSDEFGENVSLSGSIGMLKNLRAVPASYKENIATIMMAVAAEAGNNKIAVALLPCELRAAVELIKLNRLSRDNFIFICPDCRGINDKENKLRRSCAICENPGAPMAVDVIVSDFAGGDSIFFFGQDDPAISEVLDKIAVKNAPEDAWKTRGKKLSALTDKNLDQRSTEFDLFDKEYPGTDGFRKALEPCIGCHACMRVCPVCYCEECFFESSDSRRDSEFFLREAKIRGAVKIPHDVIYFHLGRINHIAASCVGCGVCSEVCPAQIPLDIIYRRSAIASQALFNYLPGRDLNEPLPITTYRETELENKL